jgi:lipopolysaccharide heptosyltransferase II
MPETVIVRLPNWLGDTVMAVPAVRALRSHWSESRLILAGPWATLLAGQGLADVLVDYPRGWTGRLRTADSVRALHGDVAVLLPNSLEATLSAQYWGARRIVGFAAGGRAWLLTEALPLPSPRRHQVDEYLLLVEHLGAVGGERAPRLTAPDPDGEARREVRAILEEAAGPAAIAGRKRIGVHVGAAYGTAKVWPVEHVIDFCRIAAEAHVVVLLGSPSDGGTAQEVLRDVAAVNLVGRDGPDRLTAVLAEMDALVCGDTGVAHLAAAMGTPVVALFGPTEPALTAPRGFAVVVRHPVPCAPCFYRACPIDHPCLRGIEATAVTERVRQALATSTA